MLLHHGSALYSFSGVGSAGLAGATSMAPLGSRAGAEAAAAGLCLP